MRAGARAVAKSRSTDRHRAPETPGACLDFPGVRTPRVDGSRPATGARSIHGGSPRAIDRDPRKGRRSATLGMARPNVRTSERPRVRASTRARPNVDARAARCGRDGRRRRRRRDRGRDETRTDDASNGRRASRRRRRRRWRRRRRRRRRRREGDGARRRRAAR